MFCPNCGNEIKENEKVCSKCGWLKYSLNFESDGETIKTTVAEPVIANTVDTSIKSKRFTYKHLIFVVIFIFVAIGVVCAVHFNSSSYKIDKATDLVLAGEYNEAVNKISDVYEPQAEIIRQYIQIAKARDTFLSSFDSESIVSSSEDDVFSNLTSFINIVYNFNEENDIYLLPEELRNDYDYYLKITKGIYDTGIYWEELRGAQNVFLNEVMCNREDSFTLNKLQENVDSSKTSVEHLKNSIKKVPNLTNGIDGEYIDFSNNYKEIALFKSLFDSFISSCENEISSCQTLIDRDSEKFNMNESLYRKNPDENYTSYVTADLNYISSEYDCSVNANILQYTFEVELMALYLNYAD